MLIIWMMTQTPTVVKNERGRLRNIKLTSGKGATSGSFGASAASSGETSGTWSGTGCGLKKTSVNTAEEGNF